MMADNEAKILGHTNIDNRIEQGLHDPESLTGTSSLNLFKEKKLFYGARKRKWNPANGD